jgi:hypothetical protein
MALSMRSNRPAKAALRRRCGLARTPVVAGSMTALGLLGSACWPTVGSGGSSSGSGAAAAPQTDPPVITSLDMTASASPVGAVYPIDGSITFTDDDDIVVSVQVYVYVIGKTYSFPVDAADQVPAVTPVTLPFSFTLSDDVPLGGAGPTNYTVTLVNKSGAMSEPVEATVDLL